MATKEWLDDELRSPQFQRLVEHEDFIERSLNEIDRLMQEKGITRNDLAGLMGCSQGSITRLFTRTRRVTVELLVDLAFHVGHRICLKFEPLPIA